MNNLPLNRNISAKKYIHSFSLLSVCKMAASPSLASVSCSSSTTPRVNFMFLCRLYTDRDRCLSWCKEHILLASSMKCPKDNCGNNLFWTRRHERPDGYEWRCSKKSCNGRITIRHDSWFQGARMTIAKILALTYAWAHSFTLSQAMHETSFKFEEERTSSETVGDWYNYCREVCAEIIVRNHSRKIGGHGKTVEIVKSELGQCVFGGLCRETGECFLVLVGERNKATLFTTIEQHILPGTCIISDKWKAYDCVKDESYVDLAVNHSLSFVDPDNETSPRNSENTWWGVKRSSPRTRRRSEAYFIEWLWRKNFRSDPFLTIIEHIAQIYRVNDQN